MPLGRYATVYPTIQRTALITVVIPTLDRLGVLHEALASIAEQTYRDVEVVVVNDGGPSPGNLARRWREHFPIDVIEVAGTHGAGAARNAALDRARGEYVAFLDDDDLFLPTHLEAAAKILDADQADFVYAGAVVADRRMRSLPPQLGSLHLKAYDHVPDFLLVADPIHTGSVVTRTFRDTSVRSDESFRWCEDWDLWLSLTRTLGYRVTFTHELTSIYHQIPGTSGVVLDAQLTTPTPFSVATAQLYAKWPSDDPLVTSYRRWSKAFDTYRDDRIARRLPIPPHIYDRVLQHLHGRFAAGDPADPAAIPGLFA
jgi:glycosyltransferase involved in cell wall biosynthesis